MLYESGPGKLQIREDAFDGLVVHVQDEVCSDSGCSSNCGVESTNLNIQRCVAVTGAAKEDGMEIVGLYELVAFLSSTAVCQSVTRSVTDELPKLAETTMWTIFACPIWKNAFLGQDANESFVAHIHEVGDGVSPSLSLGTILVGAFSVTNVRDRMVILHGLGLARGLLDDGPHLASFRTMR